MGILTPILKIGSKIVEWIPGRIEKLKNELDTLKEEKANLLIQKADEKKANRMVVIDKRIAVIERLLANKVND